MAAPPWLPLAVLAVTAWILTRGGGDDTPRGAKAATRATADERDYVTSSVAALGWPKGEVDRVIRNESGWVPSAVNPHGNAVGLIQFMPRTLKAYGYPGDWRNFRHLSAREQTPYIVRHFRSFRWRQPGDTYVATAWPAALGKDDGYIVAKPGSPAWRANPTLRESKTGPITAGSIRRRIL